MKFLYIILISLLFLSPSIYEVEAQDTFSIVAVDTVTGEIGSAGASCVGAIGGIGAFILSDVIEGIGAIHTQASYNATNQQNAHNRMLEGLSPQEIIDWLVANDAQNNPTVRQYGIVDLTRNGESAAYTGVNCLDYKNHETDAGYSVQGNILLGQVIIDTMATVYLLTSGEPLADRLMKTLEAAKIIGADTRCAPRGTSSQSGFIKVVRIGDGGDPYLELVVPDTSPGTDPIDVLRTQFDQWKVNLSDVVDPFLSLLLIETDTLPANGTSQTLLTMTPKNNSDTLLSSGLEIILINTGNGILGSVVDSGNGYYYSSVTSPSVTGIDTISAKVISGNDTVSVFEEVTVAYVLPVNVGDNNINPDEFYLYENYPDPFNPSTKIRYTIPHNPRLVNGESEAGGFVSLKVYDVLGNEVAVLVDEFKQAGSYEVEFFAAGLTSGIYFYRLSSGGFVDIKKMILLK